MERPPDRHIGGRENPYLLRWFVIPRTWILNVFIHRFLRSDSDEALHDHPWLFNISVMLEGAYTEHSIKAGGINKRVIRESGRLEDSRAMVSS